MQWCATLKVGKTSAVIKTAVIIMAVSTETGVLPFIVKVATLLKIVPGDYSEELVFKVVFGQGKAADIMDITLTWLVQIYLKFQLNWLE